METRIRYIFFCFCLENGWRGVGIGISQLKRRVSKLKWCIRSKYFSDFCELFLSDLPRCTYLSDPVNFCRERVVEEVLGLAAVHREQGVVKLRWVKQSPDNESFPKDSDKNIRNISKNIHGEQYLTFPKKLWQCSVPICSLN